CAIEITFPFPEGGIEGWPHVSKAGRSSAILDGGQDGHLVIDNPHLPVLLATRALKPRPLPGRDHGSGAASNLGRYQAATPTAVRVRAGHRITCQHESTLSSSPVRTRPPTQVCGCAWRIIRPSRHVRITVAAWRLAGCCCHSLTCPEFVVPFASE